jgi:ubiquinone/menaquinone biosynthesis C-methylase UbiE
MIYPDQEQEGKTVSETVMEKMRDQKEPQRSTWDRFWTRERSVKEVYHNDDRIPENLKKVLDLKGKKVLEVGAGTARDSLAVAKLGAEVYILDYVRSSLEIAKQVFAENNETVRLILADGTSTSFPSNTFDVVFHQGLLEHFRNPGPLLLENIRILKPGGLLLVDVPQKYHLYTVVKHLLILVGKWFAGWETEFTVGQLKRLMQDKNLEIIHAYGSYMKPSFMYRALREALLRIGIQLPMYPAPMPGVSILRKKARSWMIEQPFAFYTFISIGVIGRKKGHES